MKYLAYLKYLGINPVKAIRQLPGAAVSDDALNDIFEHASAKPVAAKLAVDVQALVSQIDDSAVARPHLAELNSVTHIDSQSDEPPSPNHVALVDTFTAPVEAKKEMPRAAAPIEDELVSDFIVWVYWHETLNALVLAETPLHDRENIKLSINLLQNILKALSPAQASSHGWTRDRFQWPLNVGIDKSISSASEVFQGYLQNMQRPQSIIVFTDKYLHALLDFPAGNFDEVKRHHLNVVWPQCETLLSESLSAYVQQPQRKKPLWLAIKDLYNISS